MVEVLTKVAMTDNNIGIWCGNCDKEKPIKAAKKCSACWNYKQRYGIDRPARLYNKPIFCKKCKDNYIRCKGLCFGCYNYQLVNNGKARPRHLRNKTICKNPNCGKPLFGTRRGFCKPCYNYDLARGVDRPLRYTKFLLDDGYFYCKNPNCDKPIKSKKRQGYCSLCFNWQRKYKKDRPRELCPQKIDLGWCDCGEVAKRELEIALGENGKTHMKLILCESCYDLECSVGVEGQTNDLSGVFVAYGRKD